MHFLLLLHAVHDYNTITITEIDLLAKKREAH
jgi:hypothetical protein